MAISLASISRDPIIAPPRVVLYAPHGVGKTTWACGAYAPILLPTEDGKGLLDVPSFPLLKSWSDVMDAIGALFQESHEYSTLIIDSLDWLEPIVWAETCRKHEKADIEAFGYGKGYLAACEQWRIIFDGLKALREEKNMAIVLLAHTEIKRFEAPDTEPYDRYKIKLQERAAALVEEWADCVLFANYKTHIAKADVGFNKKVARGVGTGERVLYTEERPAHRAKNRYGLPAELPMPKVGGWQVFMDALTGNASAAA